MQKRLRGCPNCGKQKTMERTLMESDGALIEIKHDGSMWQAARVPAKKWTQAERELFFMKLKAYGAAHGYKPGWAAVANSLNLSRYFIEVAAAGAATSAVRHGLLRAKLRHRRAARRRPILH